MSPFIEPVDLEYFLQIADLAYISGFHVKRMKRDLRAFHVKNDACHCEERAQLEKRFSRLKETLLESKILESHTSYGGDIIILIRGAVMIITYRGTQITSVADLRADLATCLTPAPTLTYHYQTPRIHNGFYRQYRGLQPFIQQCIDLYQPRVIYNVGHSLGGALATIASLDFSMRQHETNEDVKIVCITFGSPKVGDSVFTHHFNLFMSLGTSFRVAHPKDVITRFPFFKSGYRHVNGLNHRSFTLIGRNHGYVYSVFNSIRELFTGFDHHHLSSYLRHLLKPNNNQI